jgi:hypothetical protein
MLPDPNSISRHGKPEKAFDVNEHKHICTPCAWGARSNVTTLIKTCDGSKGQEISVAGRLRKELNAIISPHSIA